MDSILLLMYVYAFIIGICIASFINVVIYRVPLKLNFVSGRSFCPNCHNDLKPYDMIPVFSWFILRGKCRFCKQPISIRYPLIELLGGVLGVLIFHHYGFSWNTLLVFTFTMGLLAITFIDYDTMIIPNGLIIFALICAIINMLITPNFSVINHIIGIFVVSLPMMAINAIVHDSFGGGDIKLMAVCGLMMGWTNILLAMFIGILLAGSYAIFLIVTKRIDKKSHIAFGPYLCIGIFIALLYGGEIIQGYLSLFGF